MASAFSPLVSPAAVAGLAITIGPPTTTGVLTWCTPARGHLASTLRSSLAVEVLSFLLVQRLAALPGG